MGKNGRESSQTTPASDPEVVRAAAARGRLRMWSAVAAAVLVGGTIAAVFAAEAVAGSNADQSRRQFTATAAAVTSTLQLAIQHENDLVVNEAALVADNPTITNAGFVRWASSVHAYERYPELLTLGAVVVVPASQLTAFAARAVQDPVGPLGPGGSFEVSPPGNRPFYCLVSASKVRDAALSPPAGTDYCDGALGPAILAARDSGTSAYLPLKLGKTDVFALETPVYRGGVVPATVAGRRQAFVAWVGTTVIPKVVLDRALAGHSGVAVSMHYQDRGSKATFRSGSAPGGAQAVSTNLHNGWTITTAGMVAGGGLFTNGAALALLLAGIALSALLGALVLVLATGRIRALRLVEEKTGELHHQALHDALTGLPNRALITDRIEQLLARNRRSGTSGSALYVDLDEFKNVNDTLGHEAGDRLLQAVAARLTASLRDADTIGRMGGDEFVVLIDGVSLQSAPELVAERILEVMLRPFEIEGSTVPMVVTTSVGIAVGYRETPGELLRDADVALYQAKAAGKNCYELFGPEMETFVQHRYELEFDLRSALQGDQFRLVYQPIYNLDDLTLIGVEALIRWDHPTLGEIQPEDFVPLLESSTQIIEVGRWVLREACSQMAAWRELGSDLTVSVNVSGRQLDRDVVVEHVGDALESSGLDPGALTVEVTETALMRNVDTTARRLRELKELGVKVAIDDFGTGYSSLAYLQRFPVDCLKIDRTFIESIHRSPESDALIHTLVQLGKDLGLTTLAEGVETAGQMDHLRHEHVDEAQGFLLAKPLDPESFRVQILDATLPVRPTRSTPRSVS